VLYLVLGLVLAAFGLLIAALTTANTLFAWISVAVSVIAAGLLVFDWLRGRRRVVEAAEDAEPDPVLMTRAQPPLTDRRPPLGDMPDGTPPREPGRSEPPGLDLARPAEAVPEEPDDDDPFLPEPAAAVPDRPVERPERQPVPEEPGEPGEEQTDATDLLVVSDLPAEVRVVDEHPRYHLATCTFLHDKATLPLPVAEARQLGFTPCARCGPDATLAARHRAAR
jgi:hypothetical protein